MRPAQTLTVERLETRCVLSAGPVLPPPPAHSPVETFGPSLVAAAHSAAPDMGNHHVVLDPDQTSYAPEPSNSGQSAVWGREPVVTYVEVTISIHNPPPSFGYNDGGFFDVPSRPEYRPPSGSRQLAFVPLEGASAGSTSAGPDSSEAKVNEHANLSLTQTHDQASSQSAALNRVATSATNQTAYPVAPLTARTTTLTTAPAATEQLELLGKRSAAANVVKSAGNPSQAAISWAASAAQFVQSSAISLPAGDLIADFVRGVPGLAEMRLPSVQEAIDTVMADIKLIGTEVSGWLEGIHLTPMILAVTAATAGAGAAAYLRRRTGREARDRDEEASSSWLFARLQPIPLEA
jgi:hypothetical protein